MFSKAKKATHVTQTNELLLGGPGGRGMWVSYSAGNFLSNQSDAQGTVMAGIGLFVWADVVVSTDADGGQEARVKATTSIKCCK